MAAAQGSLPASQSAGGWEARLVYSPYPSTEPLATFSERALIIGVGNFGAAIIEGIYSRLDDVNALGDNVPNRPKFLHLTMPAVGSAFSDYGENTRRFDDDRFQSIVITGAPQVVDADELADVESWQWVKTLGNLQPNRMATGRAAARIILHNNLRFPSFNLLTHLREFGKDVPFTRVFIAVGADDAVGAQLVGDLTALIRMEWAYGDSVEIYALTAASTKEQTSNSVETWTAAAVFEMAALTSSTRLSWTFPNSKVWNPDNAERQLLNGVLLTRTTEFPQPQHEIDALLWAFLTSEAAPDRSFLREITGRVQVPPIYIAGGGGRYLPTTSLFFARELMLPIRFVRELRVLQVMIEFIGQNVPVSINRLGQDLSTGAGITAALEPARPVGLIAWLKTYSNLMRQDVSILVNELDILRHDLQKQQQKTKSELLGFLQSLSAARIVPDNVRGWLNEPLDQDVLRELHNRAGFTVTNNNQLKLWATDGLQHTLAPTANTPRGRYDSGMNDFIKSAVMELTRNLVINASREEFTHIRDRYMRETSRVSQWVKQYDIWQDLIKNVVRIGLPDGMVWLHYSTTQLRGIGIDQSKLTTDGSQALQVTLFPRAGLAYLRLDTNVNPSLLRSSFVLSMQHIVSDVFDWKKNVSVAYNLQAALTFVRAFKRFSQCCNNGTLTARHVSGPDGRPLLPFPQTGFDYNWEPLLWSFIDLYTQSEGFTDLIDRLALGEAVGSAILPDNKSKFRDQLQQAIKRVTAADCPPYFKD